MLRNGKKFKKMSKNKLYMSGSSAKYTRDVQFFFKKKNKLRKNTIFVSGIVEKIGQGMLIIC